MLNPRHTKSHFKNMALHTQFNSLRSTTTQSGQKVTYYSLPALEEAGVGPISKLPVSIRIVLEAVLRNFDGKRVSENDIKTLANWNAKAPVSDEIPFIVARRSEERRVGK